MAEAFILTGILRIVIIIDVAKIRLQNEWPL